MKTKHTITSILREDGTVAVNDVEKANIFNDFFGSVFTEDNNKSEILVPNKLKKVPPISFNLPIVEKALKNLKPTFSSGPDGLCAYFMKKLYRFLSIPLATIFEVSYRTSELPTMWKQAIVIPIFKKKNPLKVDNYRPISLCCVSCKVMEKIINATLINHLNDGKLLSEKQFGFSKGKSCVSQLIYCKNKWTELLDNKIPIDVVYIDFAKAFDSVVHSKLLQKLSLLGIDGFLLKWLQSFLENRTQVVKINSSYSETLRVLSGVPQGSVLGPTLFNMYINDIVLSVEHSEILLFADDVKLFHTDPKLLEIDLKNIYDWSVRWQINISFDKCSVLHLGRNNSKIAHFLDGKQIKTDDNIKDLGVFMSNNMSSSVHCTYLFKKCSQISSLICKSFLSRNKDLMVKAYKTYVLPLLDYCSQVYSPHKISDINILERVQRRFTKNVLRNSDLSYTERLNITGLQRLETTRIHNDLFFAYRLLNDFLPGLNSLLAVSDTVKHTRSSDKTTLVTERCNLNIRKFDFACRISRIWNSLPEHCTKSKTIQNFKQKIKTTDFSIFLKGRD